MLWSRALTGYQSSGGELLSEGDGAQFVSGCAFSFWLQLMTENILSFE